MKLTPLIFLVLALFLLPQLAIQLYAQEHTSTKKPDYTAFRPSPPTAVAAEDQPTTGPIPKDLPAYENLEELMIHMEELHKRSGDRNPAIARRAADEMEPLIRASMHQRLAINDSRYQTLAKSFYQANNNLREAYRTMERRTIERAYQQQARSCTACHQTFRPKDKQ